MDYRIRARKKAGQIKIAAHRGHPVDAQRAGYRGELGCIRVRPDTGSYLFARLN
jgi:hypothetical protein